MKTKSLILAAVACIAATAIYAQVLDVGYAYHANLYAKNEIVADTNTKDDLATGTINEHAVNLTAMRDFLQRFTTAKNVRWHKADNGFTAWFMDSGKNICVQYQDNGNWANTIKRYDEKLMPKDLRAIVKPVYYDDIIDGIIEIVVPSKKNPVYLVYLHNDMRVKVLRVNDGELEVFKDYKKG
jgi:hypothetical protein